MSNLKIILKYTLLNSLKINKLFSKRERRVTAAGLGIACLGIFLIAEIFVTYYMILFSMIFEELGHIELLYPFVFTICAIACFFITLFKANVYLFRTKDYDLLMSLPIKPSVIITSKIIGLYLYNLLIAFIMIVGADIACMIRGASAVYLIYSLVAIIFIPLLPVTIASFIAFLFGFIPIRQKIRNIIATILSILLICGLSVFYYFMFKGMSNEENPFDAYAKIATYYFPGYWLYLAMIRNNIISLLLFLAVSVLPYGIFVFIVSKSFLKINGKLSRSVTNKNYKLSKEKYNTSGVVKTLFKKEMRTITNTSGVLVQYLGGPILSIIWAIGMPIMINSYAEGEAIEVIQAISSILIGLVAIMLAISLTLVSTTTSSISLEGKSFWVLRSAPVDTKQVFYAKLLVNIIICVPIALIDMLFVAIYTKANVLISILMTIFVLGFIFFSSFMGLLVNIKHHRFDYDNPLKAVKQGKSVLIMMLIDMGLVVICGIIMGISLYLGGFLLACIFGTVVSVICAVVSGYILFTNGIEKYENIVC